jgi:hypothetical protein
MSKDDGLVFRSTVTWFTEQGDEMNVATHRRFLLQRSNFESLQA